ncbi:unnamed protein product [Symbiodinium sp. CCMP2592]|nr:unnamed protein product [Symbiodinium sp. CCMP2592]
MGEDAMRAAALAEIQSVWGAGGLPQTLPMASNSMLPMDTASATEGRRPRAEEQDDRRPKWPKPTQKGQVGKGNTGWKSWPRDWDRGNRDWEEENDSAGSALDHSTVALMRAMTKMAIRHEDELSRLRADCNFMMFVDVDGEHTVLPTLKQSAATWQEQFTNGQVTTSLRVVMFVGMMQQLRAKLSDLLQDQEMMQRLMTVGWLQQGATALTPVWPYYKWDAAAQAQVVSEQQPLPHERVLQCVDVLIQTACNPQVLLRFRAAKEMEDPDGEVVPFMIAVSLRGQPALDCHTALTERLRPERLRKGPMATALEEAYLAVPDAIFSLRHRPVGRVQLQLVLSTNIQYPAARLRNPSAVCYVNSCAQALHWFGVLTDAPSGCHGSAQAAMRLLNREGLVFLPGSLQWLLLIRGWRRLTQQHDAAEFMTHLLLCCAPEGFVGCWQSRLTNPLQVADAGSLAVPIPMDLAGDNIQDVVDRWSGQAAVHAIADHSGVLLIQLMRYAVGDAQPAKDSRHVHIAPGQSVALPIFQDSEGTTVVCQTFVIAFVVYHHGNTVHSGHYQTALCVPHLEGSGTQWKFIICNDNVHPREVNAGDIQDIARNAYLVGLLRTL